MVFCSSPVGVHSCRFVVKSSGLLSRFERQGGVRLSDGWERADRSAQQCKPGAECDGQSTSQRFAFCNGPLRADRAGAKEPHTGASVSISPDSSHRKKPIPENSPRSTSLKPSPFHSDSQHKLLSAMDFLSFVLASQICAATLSANPVFSVASDSVHCRSRKNCIGNWLLSKL